MSSMKVNQSRIILLFCLSIMLVISCVSDSKIEQDNIYGNWEVIAAKRNNKLTNTLKDGYFKFFESGEMETNIYGDDQRFQMTIVGENIEQKGAEEATYKIRMLQNDTLHMSSTIKRLYFDFLAVKRDSLSID